MKRYEAMRHAVLAHEAEVDKCGQLAVLHPIAVADACDEFETLYVENYVVVALLHDVWEDTDYGLPLPADDDEQGHKQFDALTAITRAVGEQYFDYIDRVAANYTASVVKLADLWHNLSPQRQACLPMTERQSLEARYLKARDRIWEAIDYEWWPEGEGGDG